MCFEYEEDHSESRAAGIVEEHESELHPSNGESILS